VRVGKKLLPNGGGPEENPEKTLRKAFNDSGCSHSVAGLPFSLTPKW
jgi:hypothetical protein